MVEHRADHPIELPQRRLVLGVATFAVGHLAFLAIPLISASSLSHGWKTTLSGLMLFGVPELSTLLSVVVLGKDGFTALKSRVLGWVGRTLLPSEVSKARYYIGLILFLIPFLIAWISPYLYEVFPSLLEYQLVVAIAGDVSLIIGICTMGGPSWDKLRSLFVYNAEVVFPQASPVGK